MEKMTLVKEIMLIWQTLKNDRTNQEQMWEQITRFCSPDRDFWTMVKESPKEPTRHVFDGTPISAVNLMANALQGYMASKSTTSFKVDIENHRVLKHRPFEGAMRKYMQDLEKGFYWMIDGSNFYEAINQAFRVGGTIATTVMYVEEVPGEDKIVNMVSQSKDVWIAENEVKVVDTVFRRIQMKAKDIIKRWPDAVDEQFKVIAKNNPMELHEILHATLPRDLRDVTKIDNKNKPFASYWILTEKNLLLSESGFDRNPYITWRWSTPNDSAYGWGPSHGAMAEILRINKISKTMTDAAELSVFPAMNVPAEQKGKLDLRARGMNPYVDPSRVIKPIQQVGTYPIGIDRENALKAAVQDHYMVDMFLMLNRYQDSNKTATEVLEMQSEKAAIMGSITARIESELFDPLFDRYFEIGMKNGWLPLPPPEAYEMLEGADLKIDYVGPMAQIQKRFYEMQSIDASLEKIFKFGEVMPEIIDVLDPTETGIRLASGSDLPQELIRDRKVIAEIQQQRAQAMQSQMQAETASKNAGALKDLGDTNQDVMKQMTGGGR